MSADKSKAAMLADKLDAMRDVDFDGVFVPAAAELRRLSASEAELIEALTIAAQIIGHPEDAMSQHLADVLARAKEARNG